MVYAGSYAALIHTYRGVTYYSAGLPAVTSLTPRGHVIDHYYPPRGRWIPPGAIVTLHVDAPREVSLVIEILSREGSIVEKIDCGVNSSFRVELSYPFEWKMKILVGVLDNSSVYTISLEVTEVKPVTAMLAGIDPLRGFTLAAAGLSILVFIFWNLSTRKVVREYWVYASLPTTILLDYISTLLAGEEFEMLAIPRALYSVMGLSQFFTANMLLSVVLSLLLLHVAESGKICTASKVVLAVTYSALTGLKSIGPIVNYLAPLSGAGALMSNWSYVYATTLVASYLVSATVSFELYRKIIR